MLLAGICYKASSEKNALVNWLNRSGNVFPLCSRDSKPLPDCDINRLNAESAIISDGNRARDRSSVESLR